MSRYRLSTLLPLVVAMLLISLVTTPGCVGRKAAEDMATGPAKQRSPASPVPPPDWSTYTDPAHGFSIRHPKDFVIRPQDVSKLSRFTPAPLASIFFMNPTMAAGNLAGIEPPDLEVRIYRAEAAGSLESWLISAGFASEETVTAARSFRNASVTGLQVCQSTMIAPGCSIYALRGGRVYQLTPISLEGEAMIETFAPSQTSPP